MESSEKKKRARAQRLRRIGALASTVSSEESPPAKEAAVSLSAMALEELREDTRNGTRRGSTGESAEPDAQATYKPRNEAEVTAIQVAVSAIAKIEDENVRAVTLRGVIRYLGKEQLSEALVVATTIRGRDVWKGLNLWSVLEELVPRLTLEQREDALGRIIGIVSDKNNHWTADDERGFPSRRWAAETLFMFGLAGLRQYLNPEQIGRALAEAISIKDEINRAGAISALAPHLTLEQFGSALTAVLAANDANRRYSLNALARNLTLTQVDEIVSRNFSIKDEISREYFATSLQERRNEILKSLEHDNVSLSIQDPANGRKDDARMIEPLKSLLLQWGLPDSEHASFVVEIELLAKARARKLQRPKWEERDRYSELKELSSPAFLKRVYADEAGTDGTIPKDVVRRHDPKLMSLVEAYISGREKLQRGMGDAEGLAFVTKPAGRPKRAARRSKLHLSIVK